MSKELLSQDLILSCLGLTPSKLTVSKKLQIINILSKTANTLAFILKNEKTDVFTGLMQSSMEMTKEKSEETFKNLSEFISLFSLYVFF